MLFRSALLINPYDIEQIADTLRTALEMPAEEKRARMRRMRRTVRNRNVYKWAADLISELADVCPDRTERADRMEVDVPMPSLTAP